MAASRVYKITQKTSDTTTEVRLIRATDSRVAANFVAGRTITAEKASQDDLIDLTSKGCKVEIAE